LGEGNIGRGMGQRGGPLGGDAGFASWLRGGRSPLLAKPGLGIDGFFQAGGAGLFPAAESGGGSWA